MTNLGEYCKLMGRFSTEEKVLNLRKNSQLKRKFSTKGEIFNSGEITNLAEISYIRENLYSFSIHLVFH